MEEDMANVEDQDMAENGTMDHTPEDEDSEPEMKRAKVEAAEDLENSLESDSEDLAKESENFPKELTCPLCKDHFQDPVIISCSHNFCRTCIEEAWSGQESFVCPDCETVITEKMYIANRALDNLVKSISTATVNSPVTPKPVEMTMIHTNCPEHDERLKLFCKEDGALSCLICRDSLKHSGHNFLPIVDAVEIYRTQLSAVTAPLQEALKATRQLNSKQREKIQQARANMEECKQHVVTEFKKLEDFIQQQKETLLKQLEERGKDVVTQMQNNLTQVQENEQNLEQAISLANEKMSVTESTSFLTGTKSVIDKCREQQAQSSSNILVNKKLNESTYKGPVLYSVWKKMRSLVSPNRDISEAEPGVSLRDAESWDQDNLAAQAPEKPETDGDISEAEPGGSLRGPQKNHRPQTKLVHPITAHKTGSQKILILGTGVVSEAEKQAKMAPYGQDLGFGQENYFVHWAANRDLGWDSLLPELRSKVAVMGAPSILVLHVGENEFPLMTSTVEWKRTIERVFRDITARYKDTTVLWSSMLPKAKWRFTPLEKKRKSYNHIVSYYLSQLEGNHRAINHVKVDRMFLRRCRNSAMSGEVRAFSGEELDSFCMDIRAAIRGVLCGAELTEVSSYYVDFSD